MREITSHKLNGLNEALKVMAVDGPGPGGASHQYVIEYDNKKFGPDPESMRQQQHVNFQNGPIAESYVNGASIEAYIAICIDRLQGFQSGEYKCRENAIALTHLEDAMHWLQHRTRQRLARGVEGTSAK